MLFRGFQPSIGKTTPLASLIDAWTQAPTTARAPTIVGIDGPAGAGKTSLCDALATLSPAISVVHMDDFFVPPALRVALEEEFGRQIDWRRVVEQVGCSFDEIEELRRVHEPR